MKKNNFHSNFEIMIFELIVQKIKVFFIDLENPTDYFSVMINILITKKNHMSLHIL